MKYRVNVDIRTNVEAEDAAHAVALVVGNLNATVNDEASRVNVHTWRVELDENGKERPDMW